MREQIYYFLLAALFGVAGGLLYDCFSVPKKWLKARWFCWTSDVLFSLVFAAGYVALSVALRFPSLRFYHILGICLGFWLYLKSFHKSVAKFSKWVYNEYRKSVKERLKCRTENGSCRKKKQNASPSAQS